MIRNLKRALLCATLLTGLAATSAIAPANAETLHGLKIAGRAADNQSLSFDVFLPLRNTDKLEALLAAQQDQNSAQYHKWLTPAEFGAQFGPDAATVARVAQYLRTQGFRVTEQTRSLHVIGTAGQVTRAFGNEIKEARTKEGRSVFVSAEKPTMPNVLASAGARIFSFSPHVARVHVSRQLASLIPENRYSTTGPYWFDDLKQAYQYPANNAVSSGKKKIPLNGTGATIGVLIASDVLDADIDAVFNHEHWTAVTGLPNPHLYARHYINGATPGGFDPNSGVSLEASLDVQQELGGAPGAHVVLYDVPDLSDGNVIAGYTAIVNNDDVDAVSSSFGQCELFYTAAYNGGTDYTSLLAAYHEIFQQGNAEGITFLASSGDSAGLGCPSPSYFNLQPATFVAGVEWPADDPNVTSVGGTNLVTASVSGSLNSAYKGENAWSDPEVPYDPYGIGDNVSGGYWGAGSGYSQIFAKPSYQYAVTTGSNSARAVPDIGMQVGGCPGGIAILNANGLCDGGNTAMNGNGNTDRSAAIVGFDVAYYGGYFGVIGTSIASPELTGAIASLIATQGRQGNLNYYIYGLAAIQAHSGNKFYHTNIQGFNGAQNSIVSSSYNLSTGVGTPIVSSFLGQPPGSQAGLPRTPSNP